MTAEVLHFDWPDKPPTNLKASVDATLEQLRDQHRLTAEHEALVGLLYKITDALDHATVGRGASIALLAAQYQSVIRDLLALPTPVEADGAEFDVVLLPVVADEG